MHNKYDYSFQIRSLPVTWAKSDNTTRSNLLAMLQHHTTSVLRRAYTSERCTNSPADGERRFCYAFIDVDDEVQGDLFIRQIRQVEIDGVYLQARWSSKAKPRTPSQTHKVRNVATGHIQEWHPKRGLTGGSASSDGQQPEPGRTSGAMVSITYTPQEHQGRTEQWSPEGVLPQTPTSPSAAQPARVSYWDQPIQDQAVESHPHQEAQATQDLVNEPEADQAVAQQGQLTQRQRQVRNWDDHDTFQAILQDGDRVLLTTYHQEENTWVDTRQVPQPQLGTMWDYHIMPTRKVWLASPGQTTAGQAQDWLYQARRGSWVGAQYLVIDPDRIHMQRATQEQHMAFLSIRAGQQLTALSPPVWVWTDSTQLAGLWCLLMTTYHTNGSLVLPMTTIIKIGLVPMGTVDRLSDE